MTQRKTSAHNPSQGSNQQGITKKRFVSTLPAQSLCLLSSVSLLSGGFVFAQTETSIDNLVPVETSQPTSGKTNFIKKDIVIPEAPKAQSEFSQRRANLNQRLRKPEVAQSKEPVRQSTPKVEEAVEPVFTTRRDRTPAVTAKPKPVNVRTAKPKLEVPQPSASVREEQREVEVAKPVAPRNTPKKLPEVAQPANNNSTAEATTEKIRDYNNAYIDPNNYGTSPTNTYQAPNSVILTERSSGCQTILPSGQVISAGFCNQAKPTVTQRVANSESKPAPAWLKKSQNAQLASVQPVRRLTNTSNSSEWRSTRIASGGEIKTAYRPNRFIPNPSEFGATRVSATPVAPSAGSLSAPMIEGNVAPRVSNVAYDIPLASVLPQIPFTNTIAYRGGAGISYPLSVPATITSLFGWRIHPITGNRRFHAGTDLGAPMGTPILAAAKGQVDTAGWAGGYGLTVILTHNSAQQTLYGHMSEIFVQPGQVVEAGTVIGRVGSTGNSTGPHLHFEVRHLTPSGWVAIDPGVKLQTGLAQLLQVSQTAQVAGDPGS